MIRFSEPSNVTVIVLHNQRHALINQCLESLLEQTQRPADILVIDHGATNGAPKMIKPYLPYIRYWGPHQPLSPRGDGGLCQLRTDYLLVLQSDDWLAPTALEALAVILDTHPELAVAFAARWEIESSNNQPPTIKRTVERFAYCDPRSLLTSDNLVLAPAVLLRVAALKETGSLPLSGSDHEAVYRALAQNGWGFFGIPHPLGYHRQRTPKIPPGEREPEALPKKTGLVKFRRLTSPRRQILFRRHALALLNSRSG